MKIGDFGLATTDIGYDRYGDIDVSGNMLSPEALSMAALPAMSDAAMGDPLTRGVGTALYRAPEQGALHAHAPSRREKFYDSKADIFSLGIILFEMCHKPFPTAMERVEAIKALREHKRLPSEFISVTPECYQRLILWMVDLNPVNRPTAAELQASPMLECLPSANPGVYILASSRQQSPIEPGTVATPSTVTSFEDHKDLGNLPFLKSDVPYLTMRRLGSILGTLSASPQSDDLAVTEAREFFRSSEHVAELLQLLLLAGNAVQGNGSPRVDSEDEKHCGYVLLYSTVDRMYDIVLIRGESSRFLARTAREESS